MWHVMRKCWKLYPEEDSIEGRHSGVVSGEVDNAKLGVGMIYIQAVFHEG